MLKSKVDIAAIIALVAVLGSMVGWTISIERQLSLKADAKTVHNA